MTKNKFLVLAERRFTTAKDLYAMRDTLDYVIEDVCFHIQQGIELCIKALCKECNKDIPNECSVRLLLPNIYSAVRGLKCYSDLLHYADEISSWGTDSVYVDDFFVPYTRVVTAMDILEVFIDYCRTFNPTDIDGNLSPELRVQLVLDVNNEKLQAEDVIPFIPQEYLNDVVEIPVELFNTAVMHAVSTFYKSMGVS